MKEKPSVPAHGTCYKGLRTTKMLPYVTTRYNATSIFFRNRFEFLPGPRSCSAIIIGKFARTSGGFVLQFPVESMQHVTLSWSAWYQTEEAVVSMFFIRDCESGEFG